MKDYIVKEDNGALRYNAEKAPVHLIPTDALMELVKVYREGAKKYAPRNWERGMDWSKCFDSLMRHSFAWLSGENLDAETECLHMAHAAWNALALVAYHLRDIGTDDRHQTTAAHVKSDPNVEVPTVITHKHQTDAAGYVEDVAPGVLESIGAPAGTLLKIQNVNDVYSKKPFVDVKGLRLFVGNKVKFNAIDDEWEIKEIYKSPLGTSNVDTLRVENARGTNIDMLARHVWSLAGTA